MRINFELYMLPAITGCWFIFSFIITYAISVSNGHVIWYFPYISDTGAVPPESCVFSQLINMAAILMFCTMFVRYKYLLNACRPAEGNEVPPISKKWIKVAFVFGSISCLGLSLAANFQEVAVGEVHFLGAVFAFGVGSFYFITDAIISYVIRKEDSSEYKIKTSTLYFRIFLACCIFPMFVAQIFLSQLAFKEFKGKDLYHWTQDDGAFEIRLAATFSEWIMTAFILIYVVTFTNEFKSIVGFSMDCKFSRQTSNHNIFSTLNPIN